MNHLKIILVVTSLLLIGFVCGFHTHRYVATKKIREVAELRMARGFQSHFFANVQATEVQKQVLKPIVGKYAKKVAANNQVYRQNRHVIIDSLLAEVKSHINDGQWQRLRESNKAFRARKPSVDWKENRKKKAQGEKIR